MPKSFFLKKEVNVIISSVLKSLYNLLEKHGKWDKETRTHKPKTKPIGRADNPRLTEGIWKEKELRSKTIWKDPIRNWSWENQQEAERDRRIHDPTPPETRRSTILIKINLHFRKINNSKTKTFLILEKVTGKKNFSLKFYKKWKKHLRWGLNDE